MDTNIMTNEVVAPGTSATTSNPAEIASLADVIGSASDEGRPGAHEMSASTPETNQTPREPKYLAGKRAEWEAAHKAEMDALRGQLTTLREYVISQEADKLVADGKISDREMALNYLRMQQGMEPVTKAEPKTPPRDESGRFVSTQNDDAKQRAQALIDQATMLQRATGVDVMGIYNTNQQAREMILSGAGDFADVLAAYGRQNPKAPAPIRGSSGIGMGNVDFSKMSDSQLDKVNELLRQGYTIDVNA